MSLDAWREPQVGKALAAIFEPALRPYGFAVANVSDSGVELTGGTVRFEAAYVPRDGELSVYVVPNGTSERLSFGLYLRAIGSDAATRLGDGVTESADAALAHAAIYAAAIGDAAQLLGGDPHELDRARRLRWWAG